MADPASIFVESQPTAGAAQASADALLRLRTDAERPLSSGPRLSEAMATRRVAVAPIRSRAAVARPPRIRPPQVVIPQPPIVVPRVTIPGYMQEQGPTGTYQEPHRPPPPGVPY